MPITKQRGLFIDIDFLPSIFLQVRNEKRKNLGTKKLDAPSLPTFFASQGLGSRGTRFKLFPAPPTKKTLFFQKRKKISFFGLPGNCRIRLYTPPSPPLKSYFFVVRLKMILRLFFSGNVGLCLAASFLLAFEWGCWLDSSSSASCVRVCWCCTLKNILCFFSPNKKNSRLAALCIPNLNAGIIKQ